MRSAPAFRLAGSLHMRAPGLRQGLLPLVLEFTPLVRPLHPRAVCVPPGPQDPGGVLPVTEDSLAQPWLWATRMQCWPLCLLRPLCESGGVVWLGEEQWDDCSLQRTLFPSFSAYPENVELGSHDHCHWILLVVTAAVSPPERPRWTKGFWHLTPAFRVCHVHLPSTRPLSKSQPL